MSRKIAMFGMKTGMQNGAGRPQGQAGEKKLIVPRDYTE
jgi:hypothetical protein